MYEGQHLMGLVEDSKVGDPVPDSNSCVSAEYNSSFAQSLQVNPTAANLDPILFNDLVQIVPLVQTLIERKASSSFAGLGSMIYTKTPSIESLSKKITDSKGRNIAQSIHTRKKSDQGEKEQGKNGSNNPETDGFSVFASRALTSENDREELVILKEQVEDLQRQLMEKYELLKSRNQMNAQLNELKQQASEKDSLLKSTQQQLKDAKIKLADKQAALERIQWEAMTSNKEVENLQEELNSVQGDISLFMLLLEGLKNSDTAADCGDNMTSSRMI